MNNVVLMGRLTKDPDVRYVGGESNLAIARYTLAVDRRFKRDGEPTADFINCVAFGKVAELAEKYLYKGFRVAVSGRIQTGSYTNKDNVKVFTTEVVVEQQEFAQGKADGQEAPEKEPEKAPDPVPEPRQSSLDDFMSVPEALDEELPFA